MNNDPFFKPKGSWVTVLAVSAIAAAVSSVTSIVLVYSVLRSQNTDQISLPTTSAEETTTVSGVAALGRLEPQGEVIQLSAPAFIEGSRVDQLLVKLGDRVQFGQVVAVLDSRDRFLAALERAKKQQELRS